jgi:hypothetical protein
LKKNWWSGKLLKLLLLMSTRENCHKFWRQASARASWPRAFTQSGEPGWLVSEQKPKPVLDEQRAGFSYLEKISPNGQIA